MSDERFGQLLGKYVSDVPQAVVERLAEHYRLLLKWNARINLTKIDPGEELVRRHYAESLFLAHLIPAEVRTVIDAGSGAGFPGVPVAIRRPEIKIELVESDQRKAIFLRESTLDVSNIEVTVARLESLSLPVDAVISRAVDVGEVRKFAFRNSRWLGVLTSEEIAGKFDWDFVTPLPWEPTNVVAKFHVKHHL